MKIQIDTTDKIVKVEEIVNLGELTEELEKLLPNGEWKEYKLETTIDWNNPIIIPPHNPQPSPWWEDRFELAFIGNECDEFERRVNEWRKLEESLKKECI